MKAGGDSSSGAAATELIGRCYDAALDPLQWTGLADEIATTFGSTSAVLKLHGGREQIDIVETTDNLVVPDRLTAWAQDWHRRDLWVQRSQHAGLSKIVTSDALVTGEEQKRSGFYREWLSHLEIFHMIGAVFPVGPDTLGVMGIHRPEKMAGFGERERRLLAMLLPHVARAMRLHSRMAGLAIAGAAAEESLENLDTGIVIVDGTGQVVRCNGPARATLDRREGLRLQEGRLMFEAPSLQCRFNRAVRLATGPADGRATGAHGSTLRLDREDGFPLTIMVTPLRPHSARNVWQRPLALVMLRDPLVTRPSEEVLRSLFGLTAAEARVAAELAKGQEPLAIAAGLGAGIATIRSHIKQILLKTGTRRQAEAVALIAGTVAALGRR